MKQSRHVVNTDKCVENIGNRFDLVLVASLRARELKRRHTNLVNSGDGPVITALHEIEVGKIGKDYLRKIK